MDDGERVIYVLRRTDLEKNKYFSNLWMVQASDGEPRPFTQGDHCDGGTRWSPDGRWIAFTSDPGEKAQVWRIPVDGGEAEALTKLDEGAVGEIHWSPNGTRIAFTYRAKPAWARKEAVEEREKQHRSPPSPIVAPHRSNLSSSFRTVKSIDTIAGLASRDYLKRVLFECGLLRHLHLLSVWPFKERLSLGNYSVGNVTVE